MYLLMFIPRLEKYEAERNTREKQASIAGGFAIKTFQSSLRGSVLLLLWLFASCAGATNSPTGQNTPTTKPMSPPPSTGVSSTIRHYEYVFPDGGMDVYDLDHNFALIQHVNLPTSAGGRGAAVSLPGHILYIAYGSDSDSGGSQLAYDLVAGKIVNHLNHYHFHRLYRVY